MKKIDLGQTIQISANIGVLVGIFILAYEIRQNSTATEIAAAQNVVSSLTEQINLLVENDELVELFLSAEQGTELTPSEMLRRELLISNQFRAMQTLYFQYEQGALDEALWHTTRLEFAQAFQSRSMQEFWEQRRAFYMPSFNEELEALREDFAALVERSNQATER